MPYTLQWLVDKRIIYSKFLRDITISELEKFIEEQHAMIAQGTPPVHHIGDNLAPNKIKFQLSGLQTFSKSLKQPEEVGWHIEVAQPGIKRMASALALQFARARFRQFSTLEEAVTFLQERDMTLPPIDLSVLGAGADQF